jgi:hypothetical protein
MSKIKEKINNNIFVIIVVVSTLYSLGSIFFFKSPVIETLLQNYLVWVAGIMGIISFFLHWYSPIGNKIAAGIGWAPSPFQKEVAAADGAFGILGFLCIWMTGDFWTATIIGYSFMLFMMGVGHVIDIKKRENRSPLNAGTIVYFGLLFPVVLVTLLILFKLGY